VGEVPCLGRVLKTGDDRHVRSVQLIDVDRLIAAWINVGYCAGLDIVGVSARAMAIDANVARAAGTKNLPLSQQLSTVGTLDHGECLCVSMSAERIWRTADQFIIGSQPVVDQQELAGLSASRAVHPHGLRLLSTAAAVTIDLAPFSRVAEDRR
jgi:hypothetical protein